MNAFAISPVLKSEGIVDYNPLRAGAQLEVALVLGKIVQFTKRSTHDNVFFHCAIGNDRQRQRVTEVLEATGYTPTTLTAATAVLAELSTVGCRSYI
jgi:hypothetical protein